MPPIDSKSLILACLALSPLLAAASEPDYPEEKSPSPGVICRGIRLVGDDKPLIAEPQLVQHDGVEFCNLAKEDLEESFAKKLEMDFLDRPIDDALISELYKAVEQFYEQKRHALAEVVIPAQEVSKGIVQVRVLESRVANVFVEGGKNTSPERLKKYLGVEKGEIVNTQQIRQNLNFINRNLFRHVDLVYSPGVSKQTTDIALVVEDRRKVKVYAGSDNSGVETTGRARWFSGIDCSNFFNTDGFFAYQYTASYDLHKFQANTMQYIAFLPWRHVLNLYGGYSALHADLPLPAKKSHGQSFQASGRYVIPLAPSKSFEQEGGFGFDFKRTNNTVEFAETTPTIGPNVNLSQLTFHYGGFFTQPSYRIDFNMDLFWSPGEMLGDEANSLYEMLRPAAKNHWIYGTTHLRYVQKLPNSFYLSLILQAQLASQNLLPSEQIGLGGFDSVRGYDQRQLNYDSGCVLNAEILAPSFSVFMSPKAKKSWKDSLQFLAFIDYGYGGNHNEIGPGAEPKNDFLLGIGPGMRYTIDPWLQARLDFGIKLHEQALFTGGDAMWYFSLTGNL